MPSLVVLRLEFLLLWLRSDRIDITKRKPQCGGTGADTLGKLVRKTPAGKAFAFLLAEIDGLKTMVGEISPSQSSKPVRSLQLVQSICGIGFQPVALKMAGWKPIPLLNSLLPKLHRAVRSFETLVRFQTQLPAITSHTRSACVHVPPYKRSY